MSDFNDSVSATHIQIEIIDRDAIMVAVVDSEKNSTMVRTGEVGESYLLV